MNKTSNINRMWGGLALVVASLAALPASAECQKLSDVEWWTNTVPEVRTVVATTYKGDWNAYIQRWQQQRKELQGAFDAGESVEVKSRNLIFRDEELKDYIRKVDERIATLECLKAEFGNERTAQKGGAPAAPKAPMQQEAKAIEGQNLDLEVAASCQDGIPAFQVTNLGDRWPRLGEVAIYRTDTKGLLSQRRVRMSNSQQMLFKVPDEIAKDAEEVGIFIEPSWYQRPFNYDATIKC